MGSIGSGKGARPTKIHVGRAPNPAISRDLKLARSGDLASTVKEDLGVGRVA